ncbi:hypothetical protein L6452_18371 [Arctium lappa]|uniref:Uncharacterized protein n=1 Tax=Arctium lappa TaxID=4217 RepID=A0ACB9C5V9_ARCLA|nr:hypothetical protein L6452_18371 [Arctium lappa]
METRYEMVSLLSEAMVSRPWFLVSLTSTMAASCCCCVHPIMAASCCCYRGHGSAGLRNDTEDMVFNIVQQHGDYIPMEELDGETSSNKVPHRSRRGFFDERHLIPNRFHIKAKKGENLEIEDFKTPKFCTPKIPSPSLRFR